MFTCWRQQKFLMKLYNNSRNLFGKFSVFIAYDILLKMHNTDSMLYQ